MDSTGNESAFTTVSPAGTASVGDAPLVMFLADVAPNPVRDFTAIRFGVPAKGTVDLEVFDPAGRRVRELAHGVREAGTYTLAWDGRDEDAQAVRSGMYFVKLVTGSRSFVRRMVVIR